MSESFLIHEFPDWEHEIVDSLIKSNSVFLAFFSPDGRLVFANHATQSILNKKKELVLINPDIRKLNEISATGPLIFEGNVTLGDYESINTTLFSRIFRKDDKLMLIGGLDADQLIEQNKVMHHLNKEIGSLQRKLIKEKIILENTLEQLDKVNQELEEINATKDKFFSILAHDLRNAFLTILGYSELLASRLSESPEKDLRNFSKHIESTSKSTYELLEKLLEWAKVQQGKIPFDREKILLYPVVMDCIALFESASNKKEVNMKNLVDRELLVWADKHMLYTVMRNFVGNAIKYNYKNGLVEINASLSNTDVIISVRDNGIGMSPDIKDSLFRVDLGKSIKGTDGEKGTGLGLILCKEFVEKHGGRIQVKSETGIGTTFSFNLPVPS
jgi:two-component system, sensor histidine kinase and response regulator